MGGCGAISGKGSSKIKFLKKSAASRQKHPHSDARLVRAPQEDYRTPPYIISNLCKILGLPQGFDLDVCASEENAVCPHFYTAEDDSLSGEFLWHGEHAFLNPPFTRIYEAAHQAVAQLLHPESKLKTVALLTPAHVQNLLWQDLLLPNASLVIFYRSLIRFGGPHVPADGSGSAVFASAVVLLEKSRLLRPQSTRSPLRIKTAYALTGEFEKDIK